MIEVEGPGGVIVEFPDGTPRDVMTQAMRKKFGTPDGNVQGQVDAIRRFQSRIPTADLSSGVDRGFLGNFADEVGSAMVAPINAGIDYFQGKGFDVGRAYDEARQVSRGVEDRQRAESPIASTMGEVLGGVALAGNLMKGGATLAKPGMGLGRAVGAGAAEGAAYGGLYGAGAAEGGVQQDLTGQPKARKWAHWLAERFPPLELVFRPGPEWSTATWFNRCAMWWRPTAIHRWQHKGTFSAPLHGMG